MLISCNHNDSSWREIELNLGQFQNISAIQNIGDSTIFIAGSSTDSGMIKTSESHPFVWLSFNGGETWQKKTDFNCNTIENLNYSTNVLLITGMVSEYQYKFYRYYITENKWNELDVPISDSGKVIKVIKIIDRNTYLLKEENDQFGNTYILTTDGGKTWSKHEILMNNGEDVFDEMYCDKRKLWGIQTHYPRSGDSIGFHRLVSIDINNWKITDDIDLGKAILDTNGHMLYSMYVSDIKVGKENLFILGQDQLKGNVGYIWKMNLLNDEITVADSFELTKSQITDKLLLYHNKIIITYTDVSSFFPRIILLYKQLNGKVWVKKFLPELSYSFMSFNGGTLMGITQGNKIYLKQF